MKPVGGQNLLPDKHIGGQNPCTVQVEMYKLVMTFFDIASACLSLPQLVLVCLSQASACLVHLSTLIKKKTKFSS
jgi:hypothetical protein